MAQRNKRRSPNERGNVPIFWLVFTVVGVYFMAVVLQIGQMAWQRQQMDGTADSMAWALGSQMVQQPMQQWTNLMQTVDISFLRRGSILDTSSAATNNFDPPVVDYYFATGAGRSYTDDWTPDFVSVNSTMPIKSTGLTGLITRGIGGAFVGIGGLPSMQCSATARIKQVTLSSPYLLPERVLLLLDFSRTMSLPYLNNASEKSSDVVKSAVTSIIQKYDNLVNIGALIFSDGQAQNQVAANLAKESPNKTQSNYSNNSAAVNQQVANASTMGDGTDFVSAIRQGVNMLDAANSDLSSGMISAARMLLITDGDPDKVAGQSYTSGDYNTNIMLGRQATLQALQQSAWQSSTAIGGVETDVFFVQRKGSEDGTTINGETTEQFLQSLSGTNKNQNNPNNFDNDAGNAGGLEAFITNQLTLQPRCYFTALPNLPTLQHLGAGASVFFPSVTNGGNEPIFAYYIDDAAAAPTNEIPMRVFVNNALAFTEAQASYGAYYDADGQDIPANYFKQNPAALMMNYDSSTQMVEVGGMLCAAFTSPANLQSVGKRRIRMRWGNPRPIQLSRTGTGASVQLCSGAYPDCLK